MLRFYAPLLCLTCIFAFAAEPDKSLLDRLDKPDPAANPLLGAPVSMQDFISRYRADADSLNNFYEGLNPSPAHFSRMDAHAEEWQKLLAEINFDALDQPGRVDYVLLRTKLNYERELLARQAQRLASIDELLPFRGPIQELERRRYLKEPVKPEEAAGQLAPIPDQIKKLRERIELGRKEKPKDDKAAAPVEADKKALTPLKLEPIQAKRAADAIDTLRNTFKTWHGFYDGYLPEFTWWVKKPHDDADKAMEDFAKYLREEIAGIKGKDEDPLVGEPIGAQAVAEDLAHEMIAYTPQELIAIGEREFAWCEARMKETSKEMGFGDDWKAALAKVKAEHQAPGQQDQDIAEQSREAIDFVRAHDLVTIPKFCEETWRVTMIGHEQQKTMPYAAYNGLNILVAYARQEMSTADKQMSMRGNNRHFTRIVTAHELIPGHHLQAYFAQRYRQYREQFWTSFFVEGWALYWEMKLWDLNYARSPEDRIGMLFWRMHRCARIIVTLKYHLGLIKPPEMIDFLCERVGHERFGATSEVRRFIIYPPLYQCGYMLGALALRATEKEVVGAGKMKEKDFNDALLKQGPVPVEMLRATLENLPLTRETKAGWKFAD